MRPWKPLLAAGILVVLMAGALSMVTVSVPGDDDETEPTVTVPVGNLGDRVDYATYNWYGDLVRRNSYQVHDLEAVIDKDLDLVPAFGLTVVHEWDDYVLQYSEQVRLSDRLKFRTDATLEWDTGYEATGRQQEVQRNVNHSVHHLHSPSLPGLMLQGQELTEGATVPYVKPGPMFIDSGPEGRSSTRGFDPAETYHHEVEEGHGLVPRTEPPEPLPAAVSKRGTIDGEEVLGVVIERENGKIETTFWYSARVPYPVLIEETHLERESLRWEGDGMVKEEGLVVRTVLTEYSSGATPIPWGEPEEPLGFETAPRDGLRPADGTGPRLKYPLSQALEHVEETPADPQWTLWRTQNPDAPLVSARMTHGTSSAWYDGSMEWRFIFHTGDLGYEVRVEHHPDWPAPIVEGIGEAWGSLQDSSDRPSSLTLSALIDVWTARYPDAGEPDYLQWGLIPEERRASRTCGYFPNAAYNTLPDKGDPSPLDVVRVGRSNLGPCLDDAPTLDYQVITIDVSEPRLLSESGIEYRTSNQLQPPDPGPEKSPYPESPDGSFATSGKNTVEVGPPSLERGALVAVPLLVVLITVYFLPAIQFAATKGWMVVPAFSRIKRSKVLDHALRDRIHTLIHEGPGITPSALKKETGAGWGTIVHHLAVLEREELVASRVQGRHRRFFIAEEVPPGERASLAVLASERRQEIYTHLMDDPGLATGELADRIGVTPAGALKHLKLLEDNGLVERRRDGRYVRYYPARDFRAYDPGEAVEVV